MQEWIRHIAVVGAGAIGCYFGGKLARAGVPVTLIGRKLHVDAIKQNGLLLQTLDREERIAVAATEDIAVVRDAGLVLFCVKSPDTDSTAVAIAPHLDAAAVILSLQNGVDNVARIRARLPNLTLPAVVYAATRMSAPGCVTHSGGGRLIIGHTSDQDDHPQRGQILRDIAALFERAGVPVRISAQIETELWVKLVINCAYNAISALGRARYDQMAAMPEVRALMREAAAEAIRVAHAKGIPLPETTLEDTMLLAKTMPQAISSTAQDILAGRRTEIDHLNGYVAQEGQALGVPTPVNRTLATLVKLLEQAKRT